MTTRVIAKNGTARCITRLPCSIKDIPVHSCSFMAAFRSLPLPFIIVSFFSLFTASSCRCCKHNELIGEAQ